MIESELIGDAVLKVIAPPKLQSGDFAELARQVEPLVRQNGSLKVIIDATHLKGWKNMSAVEERAAFVKSHQKDVGRVAIIAGHEWHHWLGWRSEGLSAPGDQGIRHGNRSSELDKRLKSRPFAPRTDLSFRRRCSSGTAGGF